MDDLLLSAQEREEQLQIALQDALGQFRAKVNEGMPIKQVYEECGIVGEMEVAFNKVLTAGRTSDNPDSLEYAFFLFKTKAELLARHDEFMDDARSGTFLHLIESKYRIADGWVSRYLYYASNCLEGSSDYEFYQDYKQALAELGINNHSRLEKQAAAGSLVAQIVVAKANETGSYLERKEKNSSVSVQSSTGTTLRVEWG